MWLQEFNSALKQVGEVIESMLKVHDSQLTETLVKCISQGTFNQSIFFYSALLCNVFAFS